MIGKIRCCLAAMLILALLTGGMAWGEEKGMRDEDWYQQGLLDAEMSLGNNARLKKVIERAQSGEHITFATIGGSITEGAGASQYTNCWAYRTAHRFGSVYGTDGGANVHFVNAGVGGTPSTFGYMRYDRDIVFRVPKEDADGLPDVVVIEYSVNDWEEPTKHRCFESMVKEILEAPNEPAVILLFAVFRNGFNLQGELKKIGETYDLMMVSIKDGFFGRIGNELTAKEFFFDEYHPTDLGHEIMADCLMQCIADAAAAETSPAMDLDVEPAYGIDFMGLKTIYGGAVPAGFTVERGGFAGDDVNSYSCHPVGRVCGKNFHHAATDSMEPLKITGVFRKCLVAWRAVDDASFGTAEILVDGKVKKTVKGGKGKWGQSEVVLVFDAKEAQEHTLEIRVTEEGKQFTITAIGVE